MKLFLVLILCCTAIVCAAPVKESEEAKSDDVKAKAKISVSTDLQVKHSPVRIQAKLGERKSIVATITTPTTTDATTIEPTEADETNSTPQPTKEPAKPTKVTKQTTAPKKNDKTKVTVEKSTKNNAANVAITERSVSKIVSTEEPKSRRSARGRSRFRSVNIEAAEQLNEPKAKRVKNDEPNSAKRDKLKPENAEAIEKKNDVKKVETVDKEKEDEKEKEKTASTAAEKVKEEEEEKNAKPWKTSSVQKLQQKVAAAKNDAENWKQDEFVAKRKTPSSNFDRRNLNESEPKERDSDEEQKKYRTASPSAEERRNGRKYHEIQIVQLESEIEEDGKYRYNYEGEDGTHVEQEGELKRMNEEDMGESVKGSYSYKDDEGKTYSVSYTADENGYRPVGDHIPTIPPAIARALAWAATAKPWVDPWVVEQERLKKSRDSRKLSKKDQKKTNNRRARPVARDSDEDVDVDGGIEEIESQ